MFDLDWPTEVLDELADIWLAVTPDQRDRIGVAVERMNRDLVRDPFEVGESREDDGRRVVIIAGLSVFFTVTAYTVRVGHVRRPPGRGRS